MSKKEKPIPVTAKLGFQLRWYHNIPCHLTDKYPYSSPNLGHISLNTIKPWIALDATPLYDAKTTYSVINKEPLLHRKFIRVNETDHEDIMNFVNKYGLLGINATIGEAGHYIESVARWQYEIKEMRGMLELWEICRDGLDNKLMKYISYSGQHRVFSFPWRKEYRLRHMYPNERYQIRIEDERALSDVKYYILAYISDRTGRIATMFNPYTFSVDYIPVDLLSAMWVMFLYQELINKQEIRYCKYCKEPFHPSRSDQIYCTKLSSTDGTGSSRCKVAAYRVGLAKSKNLPQTT